MGLQHHLGACRRCTTLSPAADVLSQSLLFTGLPAASCTVRFECGRLFRRRHSDGSLARTVQVLSTSGFTPSARRTPPVCRSLPHTDLSLEGALRWSLWRRSLACLVQPAAPLHAQPSSFRIYLLRHARDAGLVLLLLVPDSVHVNLFMVHFHIIDVKGLKMLVCISRWAFHHLYY